MDKSFNKNIIHLFTDTFDQLNVFSLNKKYY